MPYLFQDLFALVLATILAPLILYLPGLGLVRLLPRCGVAVEGSWERIGWAMLLGLSVLPVLDTLMIRFGGIPAMLLLNGLLALWGARLRGVNIRHWRAIFPLLVAAMLWWLICAWSYVDIDINGSLYQSFTILDLVKHAAVTEQIVREGIPFSDPFYARDGVAGYYHYFYVWPAAIRWIGGDLISARMAFVATAYWAGFAVVALIWRIMVDAAFIRSGRHRRLLALAILFCFMSGADLLFMLFRFLATHRVEPQLDTWNSEVRTLGTSLIWVPHHVSAMVAAWTGMLLLVRPKQEDDTIWRHLCHALMAGAAFATMFGLSTWIAVGIAPFLAGWTCFALWRRDIRLLVAGLTALILSIPQFHDILSARADGNFPLGIGVRSFTPFLEDDSIGQQLLRIPLLPLNYGLELGLCAIGAYYYWSHRKGRSDRGAPTRALLFWSTLVTLFVASFLRSTIIYNDLGWRVILFTVTATIIWTLRYAQSVPSLRKLRPLAMTLLVLGLAGTTWDIIGLRIIRSPLFPVRPIELNNAPPISHALRDAYGWADRHLPADAVLQYNPTITARGIDFGLYGHNWPSIADFQANLFGASQKQVDDRLAMVAPIFNQSLAASEMMARARAARIDYLLFTQRDPVWRAHHAPPTTIPCLYRTPLICVLAVPSEGRP